MAHHLVAFSDETSSSTTFGTDLCSRVWPATGPGGFILRPSKEGQLRAAFIEGSPIYQSAGFHSKNHIQLCIRDTKCIKGYFRPLDENGMPLVFG